MVFTSFFEPLNASNLKTSQDVRSNNFLKESEYTSQACATYLRLLLTQNQAPKVKTYFKLGHPLTTLLKLLTGSVYGRKPKHSTRC
jgi:hypothetical protein